MNQPIREPCKEPCRTCENYRYCGLERRGICTDYKRKEDKPWDMQQKLKSQESSE